MQKNTAKEKKPLHSSFLHTTVALLLLLVLAMAAFCFVSYYRSAPDYELEDRLRVIEENQVVSKTLIVIIDSIMYFGKLKLKL